MEGGDSVQKCNEKTGKGKPTTGEAIEGENDQKILGTVCLHFQISQGRSWRNGRKSVRI